MNTFKYINGSLHCEGVDLSLLGERYATPSYVYSKKIIEENAKAYVNSFTNRSGLSTVSLSDTGVVISGLTTVSGNLNVTTNIGIGSASPQTTLDLSQTTGSIALPQGTTAQRPSGSSPYLRYNTTNSALEFYNGTDWVEVISDYFPSGSVILG